MKAFANKTVKNIGTRRLRIVIQRTIRNVDFEGVGRGRGWNEYDS